MSTLPGPSATEWNRLAEAASNIFATREWLEAWWDQFGGGSTPVVVTDDGDDPSVIWPLVRSGKVVRTVRLIGHGASDRLGPVCAPHDEARAGTLLRTTLDRVGWNALVLHDVEPDAAWTHGLGLQEIDAVPSTSVTFPDGGWEQFLRGKSKNFRKQANNREERLRREFDVTFRLSTPQTLDGDLESLFRLHRARWGEDASFAAAPSRAFHSDFAARALANGWLRLWMLELDGVVVAAAYGFRFAGVEYHYQAGRDPAFERHALGFVTTVHALRQACDSGVSEVRLLRGDEEYKSRFITGSRSLATLATGSGPRGTAAVHVARQRRRAARRRVAP